MGLRNRRLRYDTGDCDLGHRHVQELSWDEFSPGICLVTTLVDEIPYCIVAAAVIPSSLKNPRYSRANNAR